MKTLIMLTFMICCMSVFSAPSVTGVTAKQRYPWNGLVDITVTLSGTEEECTDETLTIPLYATNKTTRAELPVRTVTANGAVTGEGNQWTLKLIWNATADVGCAKFGEVELTTGTLVSGGVQLWENGPYWAECNVGASQPEELGYYFWWGDTVGCKCSANNGRLISVKDGTEFYFGAGDCPTSNKNISQLQLEGYVNANGNLVTAHDAARAHLGAPWRMPTRDEIQALVGNCTATWTNNWNGTGVNGRLVTGNGAYASKSIFLPATGYGQYHADLVHGPDGDYWSSTPDLGYSFRAAGRLFFTSGGGLRKYIGSLLWVACSPCSRGFQIAHLS